MFDILPIRNNKVHTYELRVLEDCTHRYRTKCTNTTVGDGRLHPQIQDKVHKY